MCLYKYIVNECMEIYHICLVLDLYYLIYDSDLDFGNKKQKFNASEPTNIVFAFCNFVIGSQARGVSLLLGSCCLGFIRQLIEQLKHFSLQNNQINVQWISPENEQNLYRIIKKPKRKVTKYKNNTNNNNNHKNDDNSSLLIEEYSQIDSGILHTTINELGQFLDDIYFPITILISILHGEIIFENIFRGLYIWQKWSYQTEFEKIIQGINMLILMSALFAIDYDLAMVYHVKSITEKTFLETRQDWHNTRLTSQLKPPTVFGIELTVGKISGIMWAILSSIFTIIVYNVKL